MFNTPPPPVHVAEGEPFQNRYSEFVRRALGGVELHFGKHERSQFRGRILQRLLLKMIGSQRCYSAVLFRRLFQMWPTNEQCMCVYVMCPRMTKLRHVRRCWPTFACLMPVYTSTTRLSPPPLPSLQHLLLHFIFIFSSRVSLLPSSCGC